MMKSRLSTAQCRICYWEYRGGECPYCAKSKLEQQNAALVKAVKAILNSNAKPVYGIGGKKIKGFTLYLPKERYEKAWRALALMEGDE